MRSIDRTPGQLVVEPTHKQGSFLMRHAALWLVPLSVVVALLLIEGVLQLFPSLLPPYAQQLHLWRTQTHAKSIGDPYLGFLRSPYYQSTVDSLDFRFEINSDEHGFRNSSPWPDRAEIVVVGDSMAYGYGVAQQEAWTSLLDEALPTSRVITLALPGAAPQQYARYFERFGVSLRPKVLVFTIFPGNDIVEATVFDRWVAAGSPGNYNIWRFFEGRVPKTGISLRDRSLLWLATRSVRQDLKYGFTGTTIEFADGGRLQLAPTLYAKALEHNNSTDPGFISTVRAAAEARDRARAIGSEFVVLLMPVKEAVYLPLRGKPFPSLVHPLIEVLQYDKGMKVVDLTQPFQELAAKGHQLYFEIDGHPNVPGNRAIADVLTQYLRANAQSLGLDDWDQAGAQP